METGAASRSPESPSGIRYRIGIFGAEDAKAVDSETTQIGERAIDPLVQGARPRFRRRWQSTDQPTAATAGSAVLVAVCRSTRVGLAVPRIVLARAISAAVP